VTNDALWAAVLDAFEARLAAQRDALAMGAPGIVPAFVAPPLRNPLPDSLLDRATTLVRECRELEDQLAAALAQTDASLSKVHNAPARSQEPVYFDSKV
jgi:hypothetical protein